MRREFPLISLFDLCYKNDDSGGSKEFNPEKQGVKRTPKAIEREHAERSQEMVLLSEVSLATTSLGLTGG